jgi:eukaryotic-like serine/threonine-protein kinase
MDLPITALGRFEIVGHLATGGMAEILLARAGGPSGFERVAVLKRVLPHLAREPRFVQMFLDEARIAALIRHPNVVQIQELVHERDQLYIVMEYLEGESVAGLLRRLLVQQQSLSPALAAHLIAEACSGLHAAHELVDNAGQTLGVVHRDVSPQNIFVTYGGAVKVLDFGIAVARDRLSKTETGQLKGKFEYMAPEQCRGKPLDRRADVFALGAVLYECSLRRRLFKRENQLLTLKAITAEAIPAPTAIDPSYPAELERVVLRALARSRSERYQSAAELRRDLIAVSRGLEPQLVGDDALRSLMQGLFADRIQSKRDMLRRVRDGSTITSLPAAESDDAVEIPSLASHAPEDHESSTTLVTPYEIGQRSLPLPRRWRLTALGLLLGIPIVILLWFTSRTERAPAMVEPAGSAVASNPSAAPSPVPLAPSSTAPEQIVLNLQAEPAARVAISGLEVGTTPLSVPLPKSATPTTVTFSQRGYRELVREFVPLSSGALRVKLSPERASVARKAGRKPPAVAPSAAGYERW